MLTVPHLVPRQTSFAMWKRGEVNVLGLPFPAGAKRWQPWALEAYGDPDEVVLKGALAGGRPAYPFSVHYFRVGGSLSGSVHGRLHHEGEESVQMEGWRTELMAKNYVEPSKRQRAASHAVTPSDSLISCCYCCRGKLERLRAHGCGLPSLLRR